MGLLLLVVLLGGCRATHPDQQWQVAIKGAYQGSFTPDGRALLLASIHHGASFWHLDEPARKYDWNHLNGGYSTLLYTAVAADAGVALTADYHQLVLWDIAEGDALAFWSVPSRIESMALSADGQYALLGLNSNKAVLFDVTKGGVLQEFAHQGPVLSVSLSGDNRLALTGGDDLSAKLWVAQTGQLLNQFDLPNRASLVKLSGDGRLALIAPAREPAALWDLTSQTKLTDLPLADHRLYSARFDEHRLLLGTTHRRLFQYNTKNAQLEGQWRLSSSWWKPYQSTTVLDMIWQGNNLMALGSDGYLYQFNR